MRSLVIALVVAVTFAGCAEEAAPAAAPDEPDVILVTEENDAESLANDSFMMAAHQHDYWGGKERLRFMETVLPPGNCCMTLGQGGLDLEFVPQDGMVVPHGTSRVEITVSWTTTDEASFSDPSLWVQTANEHEPSLVTAVASGDLVTIETDNGDLDLPHQELSAWRIMIHLEPGPTGLHTIWSGEMTVVAEAIRGREIPIYPPHPDLWGGAETMTLFEDDAPPQLWSGVVDESGRGYGCLRGCWPQIHRAVNGTVVPFDAAAVEVILVARPDPGFDFGLKFHGADTRAFTDLVPTAVDGDTRTYLIPVSPGLGDSPYASQSVWGFAVFAEQPERDGWFSGSYSMSARALKVAA